MNRREKGIISFIAVAMVMLAPLSALVSLSDASQGDRFMLDEGNGAETWYDVSVGSTYGDAIKATLEANGHTCEVIGSSITVDGKTMNTVGDGLGSSSDPILAPGSSKVTITSKWIPYAWDAKKGEWTVIADLSVSYSSGSIAIGFYPEGVVPSETPSNQSVTMMGYDSKASSSATVTISSDKPSISWEDGGWSGNTNGMGPNDSTYVGVYAQVLIAGGYAFIKYGMDNDETDTAALVCKNIDTGAVKWFFKYPRGSYETTNFIIVGDYVYVQSSAAPEKSAKAIGSLYKINWKTSVGEAEPEKILTNIPDSIEGYPVTGGYSIVGLTSLTYDSGAIYTMASNGMIYSFDLDLNPVWSYFTGGKGYFFAPVIYDDYLFAGMFNGHMFILNKNSGELIHDETVYQSEYGSQIIGSVTMPTIIKTGDSVYRLFVPFSDGRGMGAKVYGLAVYEFDGKNLTTIVAPEDKGYGSLGRCTAVVTDDFQGVYFEAGDKLYRMNLDGQVKVMAKGISITHAYLVLVNNEKLVATTYTKNEAMLEFDLDGNIIGSFLEDEDYRQFCMGGLTIFDGGYIFGNDLGVISVKGGFDDPIDPTIGDQGLAPWQVLLIVLAVFAAIIVVGYFGMKYGLKWDHPWHHIVHSIRNFLFGEEYSHNTLSRHRLWLVMGIGITFTLIAAIVSLCVGPTTTLGVGEMFQCLFSAIAKGGQDLTYNELMVYSARLPRTLVAIAVGVGLSIAGAMYQAIIRNPLVDPYIMGVSSGAGTAAIAVISFDFTFFGLFPAHSIYLTAFTAAIGGVLAFMCTMLLATKAGGTSINYVLAGVIVGLVFSAAQTLMLTFAGNHVTGALSWLYGSFSEVTWPKVWLVLIPSFAISFGVLFWAKEFNLVLLGEDQARQMGLDVKRFNRWMLIIASVLTSICVAFVGIIGFVGLVIPHLCRMMLGGDHRLVLPTSMAFGGFLMIVADIASRMLVPGFELPVGAITTIIGVPVFAYLLIKRGKMYDG